MKRNTNVGLTFCFALSLVACSGSNDGKKNQTPVTPTAAAQAFTGTNGIVNIGGQQCDTTIQNPADMRSPLDLQSPCSQLTNGQAVASQPVPQQIAPTYPANGNQLPIGPNGINNFNTQSQNQYLQVNQPSQDINPNNGRILNRKFFLARGSAMHEIVNDSCYPDKNYSENLFETTGVPDARFAHSNTDAFILDFSPTGTLTISAQSLIGTVKSQGYVPYVLNDSDQTITIGQLANGSNPGFQMIGPASDGYKKHQLYLHNIALRARDTKTKINDHIKEPIPGEGSGGGSLPGTGGFVLNHGTSQTPDLTQTNTGSNGNGPSAIPGLPLSAQQALGQQPGSATPPGFGQQPVPRIQQSQLSDDIVMLEFPQGIVANIVTMPAAPQHIVYLYAGTTASGAGDGDGVQFSSSATIISGQDHCNAQGTGGMRLFLAPRN